MVIPSLAPIPRGSGICIVDKAKRVVLAERSVGTIDQGNLFLTLLSFVLIEPL
jgi:hypothetical protein